MKVYDANNILFIDNKVITKLLLLNIETPTYWYT